MTQRDVGLVADVLRTINPQYAYIDPAPKGSDRIAMWEECVLEMSRRFQDYYAKFEPKKFLTRCGIE